MKKYSEVEEFYRKAAEEYFAAKYSLKHLEERFMDCGFGFQPKDKPAEDRSLCFFKLMNRPHLERLTEIQSQKLENIYEAAGRNTVPEAEEFLAFLEQTCETVLPGSLKEKLEYEYFPDIHGRGIFPGRALVFLFRDKDIFNDDSVLDIQKEEKKKVVFRNVKNQFENMVNQKSDLPVYLVRVK